MEIKRFEKRLKNQGYPCSKWALCLCPGLALFSVLITEPLLTTAKSCSSLGAERGKSPAGKMQRCSPGPPALPVIPEHFQSLLPSGICQWGLCSPQGCCTLELLCNSSWGFMQPLQVKLQFSWSSPVIPPLCCCMIRSALRGFALRLLFNSVWHYRIQKALIWKGFSLQLP